MDSFLARPADRNRQDWTRTRRQHVELTGGTTSLTVAPTPAAHERLPIDPTTLDALRELEIGQPNFLMELIELFLDDAQHVINAMWAAAGAADAAQLRALAHRLKGSSASLGAAVLARLCEELEGLARAGTTLGASYQLEQVRDEYARVAVALDHERRQSLAYA